MTVARAWMTRAVLASALALFGVACAKNESQPGPSASAPPTASMLKRSEAVAAKRTSEGVSCRGAVTLYEGSIAVDARNYVHSVQSGADYVEADIAGLDSVVSTAAQLRFTLDYPFEKPFEGTVTGRITVRNIIDAVRTGFLKMYEGTSQRDIPGMANKDVTGPYGRAFHVIGDLVIERIELCNGIGTLEITIGS